MCVGVGVVEDRLGEARKNRCGGVRGTLHLFSQQHGRVVVVRAGAAPLCRSNGSHPQLWPVAAFPQGLACAHLPPAPTASTRAPVGPPAPCSPQGQCWAAPPQCNPAS